MYFERYVAKLLPGVRPSRKWGVLDCKLDEFVEREGTVRGALLQFEHKEAAVYEAAKRNAGQTAGDV